MMPHIIWTLLLALLISGASAMAGNRGARERLSAAAYTFVSCTVTVFAGSWLMYLVHR
jgi:hypothetical protein